MTGPKDDRYRVALMVEAVARLKEDLKRFGIDDLSDPASDGRKILRSDLIDLVEPAESLSKAFVRDNHRVDVERLRNLRNKQLVHDYPDLDPEDVWIFLSAELASVERALRHARFPK